MSEDVPEQLQEDLILPVICNSCGYAKFGVTGVQKLTLMLTCINCGGIAYLKLEGAAPPVQPKPKVALGVT